MFLDRDEVLAHELVLGELLIGQRGGRAGLLASYEKLFPAPTVSHSEVVELVRSRKLHRRASAGSTSTSSLLRWGDWKGAKA